MNLRLTIAVCALAAISGGIYLAYHQNQSDSKASLLVVGDRHDDDDEEEFENEEAEAEFRMDRLAYERKMIADPVTGYLPAGIQEQEQAFISTLPEKTLGLSAGREANLNTYFPAGPNNIGGRTRAVAYDSRYNGSSNRVVLAGCVSGGIMRSADGGSTWKLVTPEGSFHNVTVIRQSPVNPDFWLAGTGEAWGNTATENGAFYLGDGFFRSTDNGLTWTLLKPNGTDLGLFDSFYDFIYNIRFAPDGKAYFASLGNIFRLTFGASSVTVDVVLPGSNSGNALNMQTDVVVSPTGKVYAAFNGGNGTAAVRGVWASNSGDSASFVHIAGGKVLGVDSVAGWRGNDYSSNGSKRIIMDLAPSNENILYVMYENGLSNASPDFKPEADLFKYTVSTKTWTNYSDKMPDISGGNNAATDPFAIQGGYDMLLAVKPNDPNFVLVGGTSLYRTTDGFATAITNTANWIGGYANSSLSSGLQLNPDCHPDIHGFSFNPTNPNEMLVSTDGGVHKTTNITATTVAWNNVSNYQTLQYYYAAMQPEAGKFNFLGGAQDNGTWYRDKEQFLGGTAAADSNNHIRVHGGDGGYTGISKSTVSQQDLFVSNQYGAFRRVRLSTAPTNVSIRPTGSQLTPSPTGGSNEYGEFVTNFRLDPDNTEDLYYVNFNRLFRTISSSSVDSTKWTEMTGVSKAVSSSNGTSVAIRAVAFTRGPYTTNHALFLGTTNGKVFRLDDPRNAAATATPINITPSGLSGQSVNIQDIAVNPNNDNEVMIVISNYGITIGSNYQNVVNIWWTENAKSPTPTWKNAEGSLAGTNDAGFISGRSAAIVTKKDGSGNAITEYYVGTAGGLLSVQNLNTTLNGGGSPSWQREGGTTLNLAVIQSIAYRPEDNVLLLGTHGNGMYYSILGNPNFVPNQNTGINDPILNDKDFITMVGPTFSADEVNYRTGNLLSVKKIDISLYQTNGQLVLKKQTGYQSGSISLSALPQGLYILSITSEDGKYRHLQKLKKL